jgi:DNA-binding NtrC family response regulator
MRLLIIAQLEGYIRDAAQIAVARGAKVAQTESIENALKALRSGQGADLVMIDVRMDIESFIRSINQERISVPVVACGIATDAAAAVRAIRAGAIEYVPLPPNAELIAAVLQAVVEENHQIISLDPRMQAVLKLADQIAPSDASVLITGESGTGKELMARYLHRKSRRVEKPFVSLNCAAIPENLLESELFGHEKGSFTGALARRIGKFEEANGGTLFLDEISEMDLRLQAKLLRAIQEREITRLGSNNAVKVDIRILATSNRYLEQEVKEGKFREDLYFRLNVVNVALPALRERPEDILVLARHFIKKYSKANSIVEKPLAPETEAVLRQHHWRGNVRELENTMHRAVLLSSGDKIDLDAMMISHNALSQDTKPVVPAVLATAIPASAPSDSHHMVGRTVADVERHLIIDTLHHTLGNRTHAATILGISIRTLRNKLKQYSDEGVFVPMSGDNEAAAG